MGYVPIIFYGEREKLQGSTVDRKITRDLVNVKGTQDIQSRNEKRSHLPMIVEYIKGLFNEENAE